MAHENETMHFSLPLEAHRQYVGLGSQQGAGQPASAGQAPAGQPLQEDQALAGASRPGQPAGENQPVHDGPTYDDVINALALDVVGEARMKLMMAFRFLNTALWKMPTVVSSHPMALATDGKQLVVSPLYTIARFQEGMNEITRDYLHLLLHCVFRHPLDEEHINAAAWSLACDVVVESIALEMTEQRCVCANDAQRHEAIAAIQKDLGHLSPAKLYRIFADAEAGGARARQAGFNPVRVWDLRRLFQRDCHDAWANVRHRREGEQKSEDDQGIRKRNLSDRLQDKPEDTFEDDQKERSGEGDATPLDNLENTSASESQGDQQEDDAATQGGAQTGSEQQEARDTAEDTEQSDEQLAGGSAPQEPASAEEEAPDSEDGGASQPRDDVPGSEAADVSTDDPDADDPSSAADPDNLDDDPEGAAQEQQLREQLEQQRQEWEDIAKQIEMDLQSFSQGRGDNSKALSQNLAIANRRLANYHDFLRQFATMGEDMKINDDEFDYIYYTYGMDTYGNMPLVEPLEYQESNRVREFVIALDTSGSCSGELIRNFVTRTYDILRESEGFGDKVNIHLIQCDNKIQADLKIENVQDLEKYCQQFQAFGFGGTDFRPVFEYVNELCDQGEFENLRGLIYFTDGLGTFPTAPPAYETAFVFMDDGASRIDVPPWAMKVVMDEEEIIGL